MEWPSQVSWRRSFGGDERAAQFGGLSGKAAASADAVGERFEESQPEEGMPWPYRAEAVSAKWKRVVRGEETHPSFGKPAQNVEQAAVLRRGGTRG